MGTNSRRYRSHSPEFKRQLVQASYLPGTSVAALAREHGVNANQLFAWRKLFREQALTPTPAEPIAFLPVQVETSPARTQPAPGEGGTMEIAIGRARLNLRGPQDLDLVRAVLAELLR